MSYKMSTINRNLNELDILTYSRNHFLRTVQFNKLTYSKTIEFQSLQEHIDMLTEETIHEYSSVECNK